MDSTETESRFGESMEALRAIYAEDIGVKELSRRSRARQEVLIIVNVRDLSSEESELLGTLSFIIDKETLNARVDELRGEIGGVQKADLKKAREAAKRVLEQAGGTLDNVFEAVSAAADVLRELNERIKEVRIGEGDEERDDEVVTLSLEQRTTCGDDTGSKNLTNKNDHLLLLKLDHMRQKKSYSDIIRSWADELELRGGLLFGPGGRLILIVLVGSAVSCKEYLRRHRTQTVDVDSTGRKCKEKMLDILWEGATDVIKQLTRESIKGFEIVEFESRDEVKKKLVQLGVPEVLASSAC